MKRKLFLLFIYFQLSSLFAQCWHNVSTGSIHTAGIRDGGTLWTWGRNTSGQLGTGENSSTINRVPKQVGTASDWLKIAAGNSHNLALKSNGTLWAWGRNTDGQIGVGSNATSFNTPQQIGVDTDWAFIAAGDEFSLALKNNGTLWAWGDNDFGQLGDTSLSDKNVPVQIGTATDWTSVSGGTQHSLGLKTSGELWAWGTNNTARFGANTPATSYVPIQIGTDTDWLTVLAARDHGIGLKTNNTLWTWGSNATGQLGDGTIVDKTTPITIPSMNGAVKIAKGHQHSMVIKGDGTVWSWGGNVSGQLGIGTPLSPAPSPTLTPTQESTISNTWIYIDSKISHSSGIRADGTLYTWGTNVWGQLGDNTQVSKSSPVMVTCPTLSVNENYFTETFRVYPNPAKDVINIRNEFTTAYDNVLIYDLSGKLLLKKSGVVSEVNIEKLANGMYLLEIENEGKQFRYKFIKN